MILRTAALYLGIFVCVLLALNAGAYCAKISGAGGGGFMIFLTDPIQKDKVATALRSHDDGGVVYSCHFTSSGVQAWRVP